MPDTAADHAAFEAMRAFFDRHGRDGIWEEFEPDEWARVEPLLERLALRPGDVVFEPGCGPGRLTAHLAERVAPGGRVIACDIAAGMVERAKARQYPCPVTVHETRAEAVPLSAGEFDVVVVFNALPHFPDPAGLIAHLAPALRPGTGRLAILHSDSRAVVNARHDRVGPPVAMHYLPPDETLRAWCEATGLRVQGIEDAPEGFWLVAVRP